MKKNLVLVLTILTVSLGFSQTEKTNYKEVATTFTSHYNNGDYVSIYNMFDTNMQKVMPLERTKVFFEQTINASAVGKINKIALNKIERTAHTYRMEFENAIYDVFFLLNENNKIQGFQMFPQKNKDK